MDGMQTEQLHQVLAAARFSLALVAALTILVHVRLHKALPRVSGLSIFLCAHSLLYYTTAELILHFALLEPETYHTVFSNWGLALIFHGLLTVFTIAVMEWLEHDLWGRLLRFLRLR